MFCFSGGALGFVEMVKSLLYKLGVALVFISIAGCRGVYSHVCFSCCHMPVFGNGSCAHVAGGVRFIGLYIPLLLEISLLYIKPCPHRSGILADSPANGGRYISKIWGVFIAFLLCFSVQSEQCRLVFALYLFCFLFQL